LNSDYGIPEISVREAHEKLHDSNGTIFLDVREPVELNYAKIRNEKIILTPLSELAQKQLAALPPRALDKDAEMVVLCHHGVRSAQVTAWLRQMGWKNVYSMAGGLAAYAMQIDASIGTY
jgi:rhodanese-related sulfurtransferase